MFYRFFALFALLSIAGLIAAVGLPAGSAQLTLSAPTLACLNQVSLISSAHAQGCQGPGAACSSPFDCCGASACQDLSDGQGFHCQ
jgi:hypothetical protein